MPYVTYYIPVEIGTIVYEVTDRCHPDIFTCPFNGGYGYSRCSGGYKHCKAYYEPVEFTLGMKDRIKKDIFLTEEEAIKAVEKLNRKGVYNDNSNKRSSHT